MSGINYAGIFFLRESLYHILTLHSSLQNGEIFFFGKKLLAVFCGHAHSAVKAGFRKFFAKFPSFCRSRKDKN